MLRYIAVGMTEPVSTSSPAIFMHFAFTFAIFRILHVFEYYHPVFMKHTSGTYIRDAELRIYPSACCSTQLTVFLCQGREIGSLQALSHVSVISDVIACQTPAESCATIPNHLLVVVLFGADGIQQVKT